jgi:TonB family protein
MSEAWKQWEGRSVDSRFPLRQLLGASSHSAVFLTERADRGGTKAAIKLVAATGAAADEQIARWRDSARLSHPNLLSLYHYGRTRLGDLELVFVVMELADETLAEILPNRALTTDETKQMLQPVLDALTFLHQRGLVHGDIQPSNILAVGETIKLSSDTVRPAHNLGNGARPRGSLDSRPASAGSVEPAGDIYSLGVTLTQALTQRSPFDSGASLGHAAQPLQPPFDDIVLHALHPDPQLRWTAADIAVRLNPAIADAPASPVNLPAAPPEKTVKPASAVPEAPAAKAAPKKQRDSKAASAPVAATKAPAREVAPTSVPLSPVEPLRRSSGSGSLLRYAVVIGVAALVLFFVSRGLRRGESNGEPSAVLAEKTPPPPVAREASPAPPIEKVPAKVAESRPAPQAAVEKPVPKPPAPAVATLKREPEVKPAPEVKAAASEPPPVAPIAMKSEVKTISAGGGGPDVLQQVLPDISEKALATIHGKVRLTVRVQADASGKVNDAQLASPSGSSFFNDAALKAAKKWQFQPADAASSDARSYVLEFIFTAAGPKASASRAAS